MDIRILPSPLSGTVSAVPSKSDAHRLLICAALSHEPTSIFIGGLNEDILATMGCLRNMGAMIEKSPDDENIWMVSPVWDCIQDSPVLNCLESGSTLRFLLPVVASICKTPVLTGAGRLPDRPIFPLQEQMEAHGCGFSAPKLPFTLQGVLKSGLYELRGDISSQFFSGLLFALPLLDGDSEIRILSSLESSAYIDMTVNALSKFGIRIDRISGGYRICGGQHYQSPGFVRTEGDWSGASFFLTAGAIGKPVSLTGLSLKSVQPDRSIISLLQRFGAEVQMTHEKIDVFPGTFNGIDMDASEYPDIIPILAIAACRANGETIIRNALRLKLKESDRLTAISDCITQLGGKVRLTSDGMVITGNGCLNGGEVDGFFDHRIVMSAAIASILCKTQVIIHGAEAVRKSYPNFFADFRKLGGKYDVL